MSSSDGGLYKNIKMSSKTAELLIIVVIAALIAVTALSVENGGFTVRFDTDGGTRIEPQRYMYGESVSVTDPQRDGFRFGGWYLDRGCTLQWNPSVDTVRENMTLYARWE